MGVSRHYPSTPDASPGHHIALRPRGRSYPPNKPPYSTHYTVNLTLECQTVVLRTDDSGPPKLRPRAGRRYRPRRRPLGAILAAADIYVSRSVRRVAERRAATSWPAASRVRASARCTLPRRSSRAARGRARNGATTHHDRLLGQSRRLRVSPRRGASAEPRSAELRPRCPPQAASARRPAACSGDAAAEASEAARGSAPPLTTATSGGDPRL